MWKRINQKDRLSSFGSPVPEPTPPETQSLRVPDNHQQRNSVLDSRPAVGRRAGDALKGLPDLPYESTQVSLNVPNNRSSEVPTASSVYSQPSPEMNHPPEMSSNYPPRSSSIYPEDISPPSSPNMHGGGGNRNMRSSPDVSPVSETSNPVPGRSPSLRPIKYNSNLPVPRKNLKKFWKLPNTSSPDQESSTVRWDEYSGEPTDSDKGKPPSTTPGAVKLHEDPSPTTLNKNYGTSTHISGGTAPPRKRVGNREISDAPIVIRPEWKGAGGRYKIVTPMFDKAPPGGQAPKFPPGRYQQQMEQEERERTEREQRERERAEQEREDRERQEQERLEREQEQAEAARQAMERAEQEKRERQRERQQQWVRERVERARKDKERVQKEWQPEGDGGYRHSSSETIRQTATTKPSIRLETDGAHDAPIVRSSADNGFQGASPSPPPRQDHTARKPKLSPGEMISPLARNPSDEEIRKRRNQALPSLPGKDLSQEISPMTSSQPDHLPQQYPERDSSLIEARFRADLQHMHFPDEPPSRFSATTVATTVYDSPPQTPETTSDSPGFGSTPNSILNRRRPVPPAGLPSSKVASRKPIPSEISSSPSTYGTRNTDSKSLPKPPPDAPVVSPVQALRAKQDVLRRRRHNLQTVIHELTNVVQPASMIYDQPSRQEIKKTVEGLKKELAEVVKDEHETGLKLHRAWKRQDDMSAYEPTSIWVRRVTS